MSPDRKSSWAASSFWNSRKKRFVILALFVLIASSAGIYLKIRLTEAPAAQAKAIPEQWVAQFFKTSDINSPQAGGSAGDPDGDKLTNLQEYTIGTNPTSKDTDRDGKEDGYEVAYDYNPLLNEDRSYVQDPQQVINNSTDELARAGVISEEDMENVFHVNRPLEMPQIPNSKLKIVPDSPDAQAAYEQQYKIVLRSFFNGQITSYFNGLFSTQSSEEIAPFKQEIQTILKGFFTMNVPKSRVIEHKNDIVYFQSIANMIGLQEKHLSNPSDYSVMGEIIYQSRLLALAAGDLEGN